MTLHELCAHLNSAQSTFVGEVGRISSVRIVEDADVYLAERRQRMEIARVEPVIFTNAALARKLRLVALPMVRYGQFRSRDFSL